jgi:predicted nucleotidyltransferase
VIESVRSKLPDIERACRRRGVSKLFLFGSAADGRFDPAHSDIDFLVAFSPREVGGFDDPYFQLLNDLTNLLGRPIDLVEAHTLKNPYLIASINRTKQVVYAD